MYVSADLKIQGRATSDAPNRERCLGKGCHPEQVSRISRIRVNDQVTPERKASPEARQQMVDLNDRCANPDKTSILAESISFSV